MRKIKQLCSILLLLCLVFGGCDIPIDTGNAVTLTPTKGTATLTDIPEYSGDPYITINDNQPDFTDADLTTEPFENYSELDDLGRCGVAYANICIHQPGKTEWMAFRKI